MPQTRGIHADESEHSASKSTPSSTETQVITDDAPLDDQPNEDENADHHPAADLIEPGETHAFLPDKHVPSNLAVQKESSSQHNRPALIRTWWFEVSSLIIAISQLWSR